MTPQDVSLAAKFETSDRIRTCGLAPVYMTLNVTEFASRTTHLTLSYQLSPSIMYSRIDRAAKRGNSSQFTDEQPRRGMRAYLLVGHGGTEQLEYRDDVTLPEPGPGEVRVAVGAAGLNNTDIWTRKGAYGTESDRLAMVGWRRVPLQFPRIQGGDIAGRIDAVGEGVDAARIDQRVLVNPVLYSDDAASDGLENAGLIGSERDGGFAEYCVVPSENAATIESVLSDAELATFPIAWLTAEHMLARARVECGDTILITGASGGVGSALAQLSQLRGAKVVAIAEASKAKRMAELGVMRVIAREEFEMYGADALGDVAGTISVVADIVAGAGFSALLQALSPRGRYVCAGAIAGPEVRLDLRTLYFKHVTLIGSTLVPVRTSHEWCHGSRAGASIHYLRQLTH